MLFDKVRLECNAICGDRAGGERADVVDRPMGRPLGGIIAVGIGIAVCGLALRFMRAICMCVALRRQACVACVAMRQACMQIYY